jgi:hypothetical protein
MVGVTRVISVEQNILAAIKNSVEFEWISNQTEGCKEEDENSSILIGQ